MPEYTVSKALEIYADGKLIKDNDIKGLDVNTLAHILYIDLSKNGTRKDFKEMNLGMRLQSTLSARIPDPLQVALLELCTKLGNINRLRELTDINHPYTPKDNEEFNGIIKSIHTTIKLADKAPDVTLAASVSTPKSDDTTHRRKHTRSASFTSAKDLGLSIITAQNSTPATSSSITGQAEETFTHTKQVLVTRRMEEIQADAERRKSSLKITWGGVTEHYPKDSFRTKEIPLSFTEKEAARAITPPLGKSFQGQQ